jgi:hypothetical protein
MVGFVADKAAVGQVFSEYFSFTLPIIIPSKISIFIITRGWHNRPLSGRSAEWNQFGLHPAKR